MKPLKLILLLISIVCTINLTAQSVYITKTGGKYHKSSCRYLKYSKKEIQLKDAISLGYVACKVCKPISKVSSSNSLNNSNSSHSGSNTSVKKVIATRCTGRTKSGNRCKRKTKNSSGRCYQH